MRNLAIVAAISATLLSVQASAESFNNDSVIALSSAGVGDAVLLAKIDSLPCDYDVSTDQIIRLKAAGVTNAIITAMVSRCIGSARAQGVDNGAADPLAKRAPGLYMQLTNGGPSNIRVIRPIFAGGVHTGGNGSLLFPHFAKLSVPQQTAQNISPSNQPIFYFYFEPADGKVSDFGTSSRSSAQSPAEFSLVRLKVSSGQREMTIGKASPFKTVVGIDPKNTIPFSMSEMGDGIFKVEMNSSLASGQYAFVLKALGDSYRIYDFQVM